MTEKHPDSKPKPRTRHAVPVTCGIFSALLGATVIFGWWTGKTILVQVQSSLVPMQFNTALGFLLGGLGLVSAARNWRKITIVSGGLLLALGLLTLFQYLARVNLGIDELFFTHYIEVKTSHPGRMAPNTALCFLLCGLALLIASIYRRMLWVGTFGSIIAGLSVVAFSGYFTGMENLYGWGTLTRMALHTSVGLSVLGVGIFLLAWLEDTSEKYCTPVWLPVPIAVAVFAVTLVVWQSIVSEQRRQANDILFMKLNGVLSSMDLHLKQRIQALERIGEHWEKHLNGTDDDWLFDARNLAMVYSGLRALSRVDSDLKPVWQITQDEAGPILSLLPDSRTENKLHETYNAAYHSNKTSLTRIQAPNTGEQILLAFIPIRINNNFAGIVIGEFSTEKLFRNMLTGVAVGYSIEISEGSDVFFVRGETTSQYQPSWGAERNTISNGLPWSVRVWPEEQTIKLLKTRSSSLVLLSGIIAAVSLAMLTRQTQLAHARAAQAEESETHLHLQYELLRTIIDNIPEAIFVKDANLRYLIGNKEWARRLGESEPDRLLGKTAQDVYTEFDASQYALDDERIIDSREPLISHEEHQANMDGENRWMLTSKIPLYDSNGKHTLLVCISRDITENRLHEKEREELLKNLELKTHELEQVVYVASHDLRSPLVNIQGYSKELEFLCGDLKTKLNKCTEPPPGEILDILNSEIPVSLSFILSSVAKMDVLLKGLLRLSRLGRASLDIKPLDMNKLLRDVAKNLNFILRENSASLSIRKLPPCHGDWNQLNQVFTNLIQNAIKYRDPDRPCRITVTGADEDGWHIYTVEDNGLGINPEHRDKIFEIFHRLEPDKTEGEGLGLTIVTRIIQKHNGNISVESALGEGSRFIVKLPAYNQVP